MRDPSKYTMQIAVGFAAMGFLLIFLAWNFAAETNHLPDQMARLISGGLTGLGFIGVGLILALVQELRRGTMAVEAKLDQMTELLAGASPAATGPTAVPTGGSQVVAGRTTYHRGDCRLVEDRHDLQPMSVEDAVGRGLAPCRICEPEAAAS